MMAAAHISVARSLTGGASSPWYDCATCDVQKQRQMGHDGPPTYLWRTNLVDASRPLAECPRRTLLRAAEDRPAALTEMVRVRDGYLPAYRRGHLPRAGGAGDQPARVMAYLERAESIAALAEQAAHVEGDA